MDINIESYKKRKCILCGDTHKSIHNIMVGQNHIATVSTCCNCGLTLTFAHGAKEYSKYIQSGEFEYSTSICDEETCTNKEHCPRIEKGRKY